MKQLIKASAMLATAQVLAMCLRLISTKLLAVFLGPAGVGVFNQIAFIFTWILVLVTFGTRQGIIKYISEYNAGEQYDEIKKIIVTLGILLVSFSLVMALVTYFFANRISFLLFGSFEYTDLVSILPFAIPVAILMGVYFDIIQGFRAIKQLSVYMVADAAIGLSFLIPLVYFLGLKGAVFNFVSTGIYELIILRWIYLKYCPVKISFRDIKLFALRSIYKIMNYGIAHLTIQLVQYLVLTILFRRLIITYLGIEANGIYSPAYGLSYQSIFLIHFTIYIYSFTKISEAKSSGEICDEVNNLLRIGLLIMTPILFILISYRKWLILLLYTDKFLAVTQIMPIQFVGDFFRVIGLAIALPLFARANLRAMLVFDVSIHLIFYAIACVLIPKYGLFGAAISYLALYVLYLIVIFPYMRSYINFRFENTNYLLMGASFSILVIAGILRLNLGYLIVISTFILGLWSLIVLTKKERVYLRDEAAGIWLKIRQARFK